MGLTDPSAFGQQYLDLAGDMASHVTLVNDTGLPDDLVLGGVETYFVENSSLGGVANSTFGMYANHDGSLLARSKYRAPTTLIEEIKLARDLAERDDDIGGTMRMLLSIAFSEGTENLHKDEPTVGFFNEIARNADLDCTLDEMYREYLIASQFTTVSLYTRDLLTFTPAQGDPVKKQISAPLIGVLPSEQVRVLDDDTFGNAPLYWRPASEAQATWLRQYFDDTITPARKAAMRREQPVWAYAFVGKRRVPMELDDGLFDVGLDVYELNPRAVKRTTAPKGSWSYPRPLLTRNFALLEAKRLLNIMDYSLLQGGTNYIVIAKKGSDKQPAKPAEVKNLETVIKAAARTGVLVGDHRLDLQIVTPELTELLNGEKRSLIGRKLAMAMMGLSEHAIPDPGVEGARGDMDILSRVVTNDRSKIKRHVEAIYRDTTKRNPTTFRQGPPRLWFHKIVLTGQDTYNNFVLKLHDRGDLPRKVLVEMAGFDYESAVEQRRREKANGDDDVMKAPEVPFNGNPGDNGGGRPPGSGPNNGQPGARPGSNGRPPKGRGEKVTAWYDEQAEVVHRVGDLTYAILDEYRDTKEVGRITDPERRALESGEIVQEGPVIAVPVNPTYDCENFRAVRLEEGVSMIVGSRKVDGAVVAKALCFREPQFDLTGAEDRAIRWGFAVNESASE